MSEYQAGLELIERLRQRKENLKRSIGILNNHITNYDIEIRDIRQRLGTIKQEQTVRIIKPKETLAQKYNRLQREIEAIEMQLGVNQK